MLPIKNTATILVGLILVLLPTFLQAAKKPTKNQHHHPSNLANIKADFSVISLDATKQLSAETEATAEFIITDSKTAKPISGIKPLAWLIKDTEQSAQSTEQCEAHIHHLHQGHLNQQSTVNLSRFSVLTLNQDNSISVVDPQIAWAKTKLQAIIPLPSRGDDWVLDQTHKRLYVTLPQQSALAVIDTDTWHLLETITLNNKASIGQTALRLSEHYLWLAFGDSDEVFAIDTGNLKAIKRIAVKSGQHHFAETIDQRLMFIANTNTNVISVIDAVKLTSLQDISIEAPALDIITNPANGLVYTISKSNQSVTVIDAQKLTIVASVPIEKGVTHLRLSNDGHYGFVLNQNNNTLSLLDTAQQKIVADTVVVEQPDQVVFSKHYAYVRGLAKAQYSVFDLSQVEKGILAPAPVEAGQQPAINAVEAISHTDMIAPTPDGHGALLANGPDRKLYYYMEGMMAASGTLDNGGHVTRGILIADQTLQEITPGRYNITFKLPAAGKYIVPLFIDQPRLSQCYRLTVLENTKNLAKFTKIQPLRESVTIKAGETAELGFSVINGQMQPITDLQDVKILIRDNTSQRQSQRNAIAEVTGHYQVKQRFPLPGQYTAFIKIASLGIDFNRTVSIAINVLP